MNLKKLLQEAEIDAKKDLHVPKTVPSTAGQLIHMEIRRLTEVEWINAYVEKNSAYRTFNQSSRLLRQSYQPRSNKSKIFSFVSASTVKIFTNLKEDVRQSNLCLSSKKYGPKAFNISTLK